MNDKSAGRYPLNRNFPTRFRWSQLTRFTGQWSLLISRLYRYTGFTNSRVEDLYKLLKVLEPILVYRYLAMSWSNSIFPQWSDDPVQSSTGTILEWVFVSGTDEKLQCLIFDCIWIRRFRYIMIRQSPMGWLTAVNPDQLFSHDMSAGQVYRIFQILVWSLGISLGLDGRLGSWGGY